MIYPSNTDDVIDSRDVIEALSELEAQPADSLNPEDVALRDVLRELRSQGEDYAEDWQYGATLIRDSYFVEYAKELAHDIGSFNGEVAWPFSHIDWEAAAEALKEDYTAVDFDGVTYWVRS